MFDDSSDFLGLNRGTEVLLYEQRAAGTMRAASEVFYRLPSPAGWRSTASVSRLENDRAIAPDAQIGIRSAGPGVTGDGWFLLAGTMDPGTIATLLAGGESRRDTVIGLQRAVPVRVRDLGLREGGAFEGSNGTGAAGRRDELLVYDNSADGLHPSPVAVYFHDLVTDTWRNATNPYAEAGDDLIAPGAGLIVRKAPGGSSSYWRLPPAD